MKAILTLLFSALLTTTVFAQTNAEREEAKRVILGERRNDPNTPNSDNDRDVVLRDNDRTVYGSRGSRYPETYGKSRERRIYEINRAYDAKIYSIRQNRTLSRYEKDRIIRQLELERRRKLARLNDRYDGDDNHYDDRENDCKKGGKSKRNNGNHYGWQKGNGNPHRHG
jgi:hypothetical protein